jgi:hypothetical protein
MTSLEELDDLQFEKRMSFHAIEILQPRSIAMRRAARRDSSININERLLTAEEEQQQNIRLDRLQRISNSLDQQLIVAKEEHRILVEQVKQAKLYLKSKGISVKRSGHQGFRSQTGGAGMNRLRIITPTALVEAYTEFRKAYSRLQNAHMSARNALRRRDSAVDSDLVESERLSLANEITQAGHQLEQTERHLLSLSK